VLRTSRLVLREPAPEDADRVSAYYARNAQRFVPWMSDVSLGLRGAQWITWHRARRELGSAKTFLAFAGTELAGIVELDAISAGVEASAMLAYSLDGVFEGRGFGSEAVAAVVRYAFEELRLDVLIAHFHPQNERSRILLERAGFVIQPMVADVPASVRTLMQPRAIALLRSPVSRC
jgi:RimJ/RimL family protein N-acetyltransferase